MANQLRPIDADNHYYEPLDAFTRHLDKKFKQRGVRAVHDGSHVEMIIGGNTGLIGVQFCFQGGGLALAGRFEDIEVQSRIDLPGQ